MSDVMEKLVSLCKRRGFVFQSSEIYGGINSCYDYGPLGVELKKNIKDAWWNAMTRDRDDVEGLEASILMAPKVWEASGHVTGFTDPMVDCRKCKERFREDQIVVNAKGEREGCKKKGCELTEARQFNLMFKTFMGPLEDSANIVYLRPETAQGSYVNFLNVQTTSRRKLPFGIAQIGKAFRNEITPGNFIFRTREFEQMEMQFFIHPSEQDRWFDDWKSVRHQWYLDIGIDKNKIRFHEHKDGELAHYAAKAFDIQYEFPFGWQELEGIHNRTDFDLKRHSEFSGKKMNYFDEASGEKFVPYIIETAAGCDRTVMCALANAYREDGDRVVMSFSPRLAPIKAAILPLVNKDGLPEVAQNLYADLRKSFKVFYDAGGSIGRRYRRQDEAGTPFTITIDNETSKDSSVTVRERDSMQQERVAISQVKGYLTDAIAGSQ